MTKFLKIIALVAIAFSVTFCSDNDEPSTKDLALNISGLENLGADYVYEGWIIVDSKPVTTGRFTVNDSGVLSQTNFSIDKEVLAKATTFILTIEPKNGDDPAPSDVHLLAGDFSGNSGSLTISHGAALASDFNNAAGKYILATPTDDLTNNENSGIWFLDVTSGSPAAGLVLPQLPSGWKYEGWIVKSGVPVTTGKFTSATGADDFKGFSGVKTGPPFPGEDFLKNAPAGLTFPLNLAGGVAVISIEPVPDNSPNPFLLKPLVGDIPQNALDHTTYSIGKNLSFPTGSVTR